MVAVDFPGPRAGDHRVRLLAGRLQRRDRWPTRSGAGALVGAQRREPRRPDGAAIAPCAAAYIGRRLIFVVPQLVGIVLVSFLLVKTIPGDPAVLMLGPFATPTSVDRQLRAELGLDSSLLEQFLIYLDGLVHGDLGTSWQTTRPVTEDLLQRFPATLELVTFGCCWRSLIGMPLGVAAAYRKRGWLRKIADYYGLIAGALPDFWLALVLIFVFYTMLGWRPAPLGRIDMAIIPPPQVTGFYTIDSLIAGDWAAFRHAVAHLVLPVLTLGADQCRADPQDDAVDAWSAC